MVEKKEEVKEDKKKVEGTYAVAEIPTSVKPMIVNTKTNEVMDLKIAVSKMLNSLEKIEAALIGFKG